MNERTGLCEKRNIGPVKRASKMPPDVVWGSQIWLSCKKGWVDGSAAKRVRCCVRTATHTGRTNSRPLTALARMPTKCNVDTVPEKEYDLFSPRGDGIRMP